MYEKYTAHSTMNKSVRISYVDEFIWFVCSYWLLIDSINGYFWNANMYLPISQTIKTVLLGFVIYKLIVNKKIAFCLIGLVTVFDINFIFSAVSEYPMIGTIQHVSKILLTILLLVYFKDCIDHWPYNVFEKKAYKVFKIGIIILFLNVFLGLLGIGYHTYAREQYGYKGFFASGNEMGGLVVTLIPVFLYWAYFSLSRSKYLICTLISLLFAFLLATKSVILIVIFFCIYIPFIYSQSKNTKNKIVFAALAILLVVIYVFFNHIDNDSLNFMIEFSYRYDKGGLLLLLLSARNEFVIEQYQIFISSPSYQQFLGMGCKVGNIDTVEMDFFDILFYYGYFGLTIMLVLTILLFRIVKRAKNRNQFIKVIKMSDIIMIIMAAIAGHILFSSTAGLYIALINSFLFSKMQYPLIQRLYRQKI